MYLYQNMPLLPTQVIGLYGTQGWLFVVREAMKRGELGSVDIREAFDDATNLAIIEQEEAGVDVISDGEMRRFNFLVGFYDSIQGLEKNPLGASTWLSRSRHDRHIPRNRRSQHAERLGTAGRTALCPYAGELTARHAARRSGDLRVPHQSWQSVREQKRDRVGVCATHQRRTQAHCRSGRDPHPAG